MPTPVKLVNGIGPKTTEYLSSKGVTTVQQLIKFGVAALSEAPGFSPGRADNVLAAAKALISKTDKPKKSKPAKKNKKDKSAEKADKKQKKNKKDKARKKPKKSGKSKSGKNKKGKK